MCPEFLRPPFAGKKWTHGLDGYFAILEWFPTDPASRCIILLGHFGHLRFDVSHDLLAAGSLTFPL
jgi:hypothetical protein